MGEPSPVLEVGVRTVFHTVLLFAVYLLLAGHNRPGGGFAGGLVAGAAFVLLTITFGVDELRRRLRVEPETLVGAGLLLATVTATFPWVRGGQLLESGRVVVQLPLFGEVKAYSVLAFDTGVFLVVVGLITLLLCYLGEPADGEQAR